VSAVAQAVHRSAAARLQIDGSHARENAKTGRCNGADHFLHHSGSETASTHIVTRDAINMDAATAQLHHHAADIPIELYIQSKSYEFFLRKENSVMAP
jgi:Tfp pilus assembly major pilin PilA